MREAAVSEHRNIKNVGVVGVGNRLMEDDGIGNDVVEELQRRGAFPGLRLLAGETDTDYCLDELGEADHAILIDASDMGGEPCSIQEYSLKSIINEQPFFRFSHHFDLIHGMKQHGYKGDGILLTIEACSINYHFGLSSQMEAQFSRIVDEISKRIENYLVL